MQCCSDLNQIRIYVGSVISECIHGKWVCVPYDSDEYLERSEAIKTSIKLVRDLCRALTERAEEKPRSYDFIQLNLRRIIELLEVLDG